MNTEGYVALTSSGKFILATSQLSRTSKCRYSIDKVDLNDCTILSMADWDKVKEDRPERMENIVAYLKAKGFRTVQLSSIPVAFKEVSK